jgi:hypothetical protein
VETPHVIRKPLKRGANKPCGKGPTPGLQHARPTRSEKATCPASTTAVLREGDSASPKWRQQQAARILANGIIRLIQKQRVQSAVGELRQSAPDKPATSAIACLAKGKEVIA